VLARFEGEERNAPCKRGDEVFVAADDVEGATNITAVVEVGKDVCGVVSRLFVVEDTTCGFEEL
jgi:hypothetical protein